MNVEQSQNLTAETAAAVVIIPGKGPVPLYKSSQSVGIGQLILYIAINALE